MRLEPLAISHLTALTEVGVDPSIWEWTHTLIRNREDMRRYIQAAVRDQRAGRAMPFATIEVASGKAVGSTRFGNMDAENRRVEIGWTWIAPPWQRSVINTEAKYLMLRHAFEEQGCMRVEFKTDARNTKSRNALLRIGAREEGILRSHMVSHGGRIRDSVYFSILDSEWPHVKTALEARLTP